MRDDFSEEVKKAVAQRVNYICSRPTCRAQTTGPQDDPAKAVNVGVAAHITAASEGGPRHDPDMLADERKSPANAIWLCQNCAKLVDNDVRQFPRDLLHQWKREAEDVARKLVGKTGSGSSGFGRLAEYIKPGRRIVITPVIPRSFETEQFIIESVESDLFQILKPSSLHHITIPADGIKKIMVSGAEDSVPPRLVLDGRLQWRTKSRSWAFMPEQAPFGPAGQYGAWRNFPMFHFGISPPWEGIEAKWASERELGRCIAEGWAIFYDEDGLYLRAPDRPVGSILICKQS
jgi:hypothetical protein